MGQTQDDQPQLPDALIESLIRSLDHTHDEECTCDDVYAVVDQYAEANIHGDDAARLMPLIRQHMELCHNCYEEYEALLDILEKSNPA
ncbi:MAG: hypothetical protein ACOY0R_18515 [Chloroflexota bacterium]|jgi:hypothetical protein